MATHSSVLAWRIPGTGEPGGLPSMGLHRVGHDRSDLAAVATAAELLYDPAIPLQGMYLEKTLILKDTCTPKFTAELFTIAKTWKQKCPSAQEWLKKT